MAGKFVRGSKHFKAKTIQAFVAARYTFEENGRAESMNRNLKRNVRTLPIQCVVTADLWSECLSAICDARNCIVRANCSKAPL